MYIVLGIGDGCIGCCFIFGWCGRIGCVVVYGLQLFMFEVGGNYGGDQVGFIVVDQVFVEDFDQGWCQFIVGFVFGCRQVQLLYLC